MILPLLLLALCVHMFVGLQVSMAVIERYSTAEDDRSEQHRFILAMMFIWPRFLLRTWRR